VVGKNRRVQCFGDTNIIKMMGNVQWHACQELNPINRCTSPINDSSTAGAFRYERDSGCFNNIKNKQIYSNAAVYPNSEAGCSRSSFY
jgi:hypothetical protein